MSDLTSARRSAQVVIALDVSGQLLVEGSANGARKKILGLRLGDLPAAIQAELLAQRDRLVAAERDRHARVFENVAKDHDVDFATRTIGQPPRRLSAAVRSALSSAGYTRQEIDDMFRKNEIPRVFDPHSAIAKAARRVQPTSSKKQPQIEVLDW